MIILLVKANVSYESLLSLFLFYNGECHLRDEHII